MHAIFIALDADADLIKGWYWYWLLLVQPLTRKPLVESILVCERGHYLHRGQFILSKIPQGVAVMHTLDYKVWWLVVALVVA